MRTRKTEQWENLEERDVVFNVAAHGTVVVAAEYKHEMLGALVRLRNGIYKKRIAPLVALDQKMIMALLAKKEYKFGWEIQQVGKKK